MLNLRYPVTVFLLLIFAILAGLLLAEAGLRMAGISYIQAYTYDLNRGSALRPGAEGEWSREGESYVKISSDGLRDREYPLAKNADTFRIAVLGDSYAEAFQVDAEKAFWSIMEKELNRCSLFEGEKVEVINFGVAGYGTAQELLTLRYAARKYDPDLVILAMVTGNDIRNNSKKLEPDKLRPFFVFQDGKLELDQTFRELPRYKKGQSMHKRLLRELSTRLRIVQLLYEVKQKGILDFPAQGKNALSKEKDRDRMVKASPEKKAPVPERGLDVQVYQDTPEPDWEEAWNITEALIRMMRDEAEKMGAGFLVVTLSNGIQVHPDPEVRKKFMESEGINNLFYPDERIWEICRSSGISVLNLAKPFQVYAEKNDICLHGFSNSTKCGGHWNEQGHFLAGRLISDEICKSSELLR